MSGVFSFLCLLCMCLFRSLLSKKDFLQWQHVCDFSPAWIRLMCWSMSLVREKYLSQWTHWCGFSPVRVIASNSLSSWTCCGWSSSRCWWSPTIEAWGSPQYLHLFCLLLSTLQLCFFLMCVLKLAGWVNQFLHTAHWKGFSLVWTTTWWRRAWRVVSFLWQTLHTSNLSPVWIRSCCFISLFHWNFFPQSGSGHI